MTLKKLESCVVVSRFENNRYKVILSFKGCLFTCFSLNSSAYQRLFRYRRFPKKKVGGYTLKQAYLAFYNECFSKNGLIYE